MRYTQNKKAGIREFFLVILIVVIVTFFYDLIRFLFPKLPLVRDIILIVLAGVAVYQIYRHFACSFEYRLTDSELYAERRLGHKLNTVRIPLTAIRSVAFGRTGSIPNSIDNMCVGIFRTKKTCLILYGDKGLLIEPDETLAEYLKEYVND